MIMTRSLLKNIYEEVLKLKEQTAATSDTSITPDVATPEVAPPEATSAPASPVATTPTASTSSATAPPTTDTPETTEMTPDASGAAPVNMGGGSMGAGGGGGLSSMDGGSAEDTESEDKESEESEIKPPEGQPPTEDADPLADVVNYAKELASKTINTDTILTAVKASIQNNFGGNYEAAWPVVQRLKDTENVILIDVANRLSLFISGTIQENKNKGMKLMKVSRNDIRELVREAVKAQKNISTKKEVKLNKEQFERIVRNVIAKKLQEGALFDTYRSEIDREQSQIEQQLTSTDIRRMAIDLFEKICDKTGVDSDSLTPEAIQFVKAELDRMVTSAQEIANKLVQLAAVVKTASSGAPKKEEG